jgi:hypothetical protein
MSACDNLGTVERIFMKYVGILVTFDGFPIRVLIWTQLALHMKFTTSCAHLERTFLFAGAIFFYIEIAECDGIRNTAIRFCPRRSQWPRDLRHGSAATRMLGFWVLNPAGNMDVCLL